MSWYLFNCFLGGFCWPFSSGVVLFFVLSSWLELGGISFLSLFLGCVVCSFLALLLLSGFSMVLVLVLSPLAVLLYASGFFAVSDALAYSCVLGSVFPRKILTSSLFCLLL